MKFWWRCVLVDEDPPHTEVELGTFDAETPEAADKKCRLKYKRMFDRLTTNKIKLAVQRGMAPQERERDAIKYSDQTAQIFTKEMAP